MRTRTTNDAADTTAVAATRPSDVLIPAALLAGAAVGWWWSVRMADDMASMHGGGSLSEMGPDMGAGMGADIGSMATMSMAAFLVGWVAMMAAMMFPAIAPMVRLYARAAARGTVAPVPFFVAGYLAVWSAIGLPGYLAWRELADPLADGAHWVGRLAGVVFVAAGVYQLTPLKSMCLEHCRSPISFFLRHGGTTIDRPIRSLRLGAHHGLFCLGCCWAIMAVLVALGTMNLAWMAALALVIFLEKVAPRGHQIALLAAGAFVVAGGVLLAAPGAITSIT